MALTPKSCFIQCSAKSSSHRVEPDVRPEHSTQEDTTKMSAPTLHKAQDSLLTPGQVAALFHVDPKTVTRWAHAGRLGSLRTPGGHRRFRETEVMQLLSSLTTEAAHR
jgi:excisionase family DNA binding protein